MLQLGKAQITPPPPIPPPRGNLGAAAEQVLRSALLEICRDLLQLRGEKLRVCGHGVTHSHVWPLRCSTDESRSLFPLIFLSFLLSPSVSHHL